MIDPPLLVIFVFLALVILAIVAVGLYNVLDLVLMHKRKMMELRNDLEAKRWERDDGTAR